MVKNFLDTKGYPHYTNQIVNGFGKVAHYA